MSSSANERCLLRVWSRFDLNCLHNHVFRELGVISFFFNQTYDCQLLPITLFTCGRFPHVSSLFQLLVGPALTAVKERSVLKGKQPKNSFCFFFFFLHECKCVWAWTTPVIGSWIYSTHQQQYYLRLSHIADRAVADNSTQFPFGNLHPILLAGTSWLSLVSGEQQERKATHHKNTCRCNNPYFFFIDFPIKNTFIQKLFYKTIPNEENLCHKIKYAIKKQKNRASYFISVFIQ